jgi:glycine/D-amino acid oxidase-like deaminating enzyme
MAGTNSSAGGIRGPLHKYVKLIIMSRKLWEKYVLRSCLLSGFSGSGLVFCKRAFVRHSRD